MFGGSRRARSKIRLLPGARQASNSQGPAALHPSQLWGHQPEAPTNFYNEVLQASSFV